MRQTYIAGVGLFGAYSGKKPHLVNPHGALMVVELFVTVGAR